MSSLLVLDVLVDPIDPWASPLSSYHCYQNDLLNSILSLKGNIIKLNVFGFVGHKCKLQDLPDMSQVILRSAIRMIIDTSVFSRDCLCVVENVSLKKNTYIVMQDKYGIGSQASRVHCSAGVHACWTNAVLGVLRSSSSMSVNNKNM